MPQSQTATDVTTPTILLFPTFGPLTITIPLRGQYWTIYPDDEHTKVQYELGHPLEGKLFQEDYVEVECMPTLYTLRPHYELSSFDTFRVDTSGRVTANALHGFFPETLGDETAEGRLKLLEGICSVTRALPARIPHAPEAPLIETLASQLDGLLQALGEALPAAASPTRRTDAKRSGDLRTQRSYRYWKDLLVREEHFGGK